ncbi:MAG: hypothetical protein M3436_17585 [Pseudomonadota bacterium]|nr:hypothetical protein [Pseudomonadota bacterium]
MKKDGVIIPILLPQNMGINLYDVLFGGLFLRFPSSALWNAPTLLIAHRIARGYYKIIC